MKTQIHPTWVFDNSHIADPHGRGDRAVRFLRALKHPKSHAPQHRFQLPDFWDRIVRATYGPSTPDGERLVRTVYAQIPRGARKTTIGAGLGLLHTFGHERTPGGSCIIAAGAEDQAQLAFDEAQAFVNATPPLGKVARIVESQLEIEHPNSGSVLRAIPADGDLQHGKTPYFVLIDELHVWKNRRLWRALKTGLLKIPNTLLVIITTAGRGQDNLAYEEYRYAKRIAAGEIVNPSYLPIIFEPPKEYDWRDERVWNFVNPGLAHGFPDLIGMRQAAIEATEKPPDREDFRQYNLNEWLDHSTSPFIDMAIYDAGSQPIDVAALKHLPCWIAVDMSTTTDLTAVVACFRDGDDYIVVPHFFCPGDALRIRADRDGVPYVQWAADGFINATPGNVIDYRAVLATIRALYNNFDVREIAFDKAYAQPVMAPLLEEGLPVVTMQLGWVTQSPALNELERAIIARHFRHGGHRVLRWCFSNVSIHTDSAGNRTMHKGKSTGRIDGAFATWMAVARAAAGKDERSIYSDIAARPEGLLVF
jgi:phage terminase large subunit-like protein